jgi:hypothetical protein
MILRFTIDHVRASHAKRAELIQFDHGLKKAARVKTIGAPHRGKRRRRPSCSDLIISLAARHRLAAVYPFRFFVRLLLEKGETVFQVLGKLLQ